ncbi:MAG: hypothetical protein HZB29_13865 [Nitrospinae bacterium]|nr:hypothetical protein [Nitrospinota bacterium]
MNDVVSPSLSDEQKDAVERAFAAGSPKAEILREALALGPAREEDVADEIEKMEAAAQLKRHFKKEGARIIRDFLDRAKAGSDVDDIAALLELAIYRDLLRRCAEDEKSLGRISMEQLLKFDIHYRRVRIATKKVDESSPATAAKTRKLAARMLVRIVEKIESLGGQVKSLHDPLMEWAKEEFGEKFVAEADGELNEIELIGSRAAMIGFDMNMENDDGHDPACGLSG